MSREVSGIGTGSVIGSLSGPACCSHGWRWVYTLGFFLAVLGCSYGFSEPGVFAAGGVMQTDIWSGVYTEEQASRGEEVYQANCSFCHGEELAGSEMGPVLSGTPFLEFWEGLSLGDLYNVMETSMPQDNPGGLSTAEYVDVLSFMLQMSEYPVGNAELPADGSGLEDIEIQASQGQ